MLSITFEEAKTKKKMAPMVASLIVFLELIWFDDDRSISVLQKLLRLLAPFAPISGILSQRSLKRASLLWSYVVVGKWLRRVSS